MTKKSTDTLWLPLPVSISEKGKYSPVDERLTKFVIFKMYHTVYSPKVAKILPVTRSGGAKGRVLGAQALLSNSAV